MFGYKDQTAPAILLSMDDSTVIQMIRRGDEKALDFLYRKHYRMMVKLVVKNSGSEDDAKDVFQDALIIFWEKVQGGNLELTSKISTYLYSVCLNVWRKELDRKNKLVYEEAESTSYVDPDRQERIDIVNRCLQALGETCKKILMYYYFDRLTMTDIADKMGFANADTAKTKKYKCKQELDKMIKSQFTKTDFLD
jgi:RNA polymerase sigma factor (sigma-70 family)